MAKTYERASDVTHKTVQDLLQRHHDEVFNRKPNIVVLYVQSNNDADPLTHHGNYCLAKIALNPPLQVAIDGVDVIILLDGLAYAKLSGARQAALLDHELCHLEITPKGILKIRPDDYVLTGFKACIERHGQDAMEVLALAHLHNDIGAVGMQHVFHWTPPIHGDSAARKAANKIGVKLVADLQKVTIDNKTGLKLRRLAKQQPKRKTGS